MEEVTTLYRPVGKRELELIAESGYRAFPPRLEWQPIFYPVLNEEYASFIAREWNTQDEFSGHIGHVLRFDVRSSFLAGYTVQKVGGVSALEYWIPSEDLAAFNENIVGTLELIATFERPS
ncbi:MAG TPA: hypothetical protein VGN16_25370 [Acidobacteriaceae bacterium]|jgi:hypothetical protein